MTTMRRSFFAFRLPWRLLVVGLALIGAAAAAALAFNLSPTGRALAHYREGARLSCCGEPDPVAVKHFRTALRLDPQLFDARRGLAGIYVNMDKKREAEKLYEEAIRLDSSDPRPYYELADLALPDDRAQAIRHLEKYLSFASDADDLRAWYELAQAEEASGQWHDALQTWESIARRFPGEGRSPRALLRVRQKMTHAAAPSAVRRQPLAMGSARGVGHPPSTDGGGRAAEGPK
jgi:tetratricopeptide (TPR) repeat protein